MKAYSSDDSNVNLKFEFPSPYGEEVLKADKLNDAHDRSPILFPSPYGEEVLKVFKMINRFLQHPQTLFPSPYGEEVLKEMTNPSCPRCSRTLSKFPSPYGEEVLKDGRKQAVWHDQKVSVPLRGRG